MKSFFTSTLPLLSLSLLVACGNADQAGNGSNSSMGQNESIRADGSNIKGIYQADLIPINHNLHFRKIGIAAIQRKGDDFSASVRLKFGSKEVAHKQSIYTGRRCPNLKDDKNKDAYIDIKEARAAIGQMTIPLDGDLNSQIGGFYDVPAGDSLTGAYFYKQMGSFTQMFNELKEDDSNESDNMIKLKAHEGLTLPGRVVIIHGLTRKIQLPRTAATLNEEDLYESIPVACGVLWKVPKLSEELSGEI